MFAHALHCLAALAALTAGCERAANGTPAAGEAANPPTDSIMAEPQPDSLHLELRLPEQVVEGDPVPIRLAVRNVAGRPLDLYLRGRTPTFDVTIWSADGSVAWRQLEGAVIEAILQIRPLAAGEVLELEATWDQRTNLGEPASPGAYTVEVALLTDSPAPPAPAPARLRILPR